MTTAISPDQDAALAEDTNFRIRRAFGVVCGVNFVLYGLGHFGIAAILSLLLAASLISQVKMPAAKVGEETAPGWMMKAPRVDEDFAERITSPRSILLLVAGFLLVSAAIGAAL